MYQNDNDLVIGVARKEIECNDRSLEQNMFWGWLCNANMKIEPNPGGRGGHSQPKQYGGYCSMGDKIGVLLEFNSEDSSGTLSYYRNGTIVEKAFDLPPAQYYPAVCIVTGDAQVTLNPNVKIPLEAYKMEEIRG